MKDCIFCKIIAGVIPSEKLYEDEDMIIINDISPQAPIHLLMIPKEHYANIYEMNDIQAVTLGKCLKKLANYAKSNSILSYRIISNKGAQAQQSVEHLHIHLLAGRELDGQMG